MKRWFWLRFFLSYLFVFLFTAVSLIVIFLMVIADTAKEETKNANQVYARNVLQTFDDSLRNLEQTMIRETLTNASIKNFFNAGTADETYENFMLYSRLRELLTTLSGVDSIYLYRTSDNKVMSDTYMLQLSEFEDKDFIQSRMMNPSLNAWTAPRTYTPVKGGQRQRVVSLVKGIPFGTVQQGLLVVNLSIPSLQSTLTEIGRSDVHYAYLTNAEGEPIFNPGTPPGRDLETLESDTTHWVLHTGVKDKQHIGSLLSLLSYSWLIFAILVCLFGIVLLFYVFRQNYKPIEDITHRIQQYAHHGKNRQERDQFAFISSSIEKLIIQSQHHEVQAAQDLLLKRNYLFRELLGGTHDLSPKDWQREIIGENVIEGDRTFLILLVEIDHYELFIKTFNPRDQGLLKFALSSAIQEMSVPYVDALWTDWLAMDRLCHLVKLKQDDASPDRIIQMGEEWRRWIEQNLKLTVTVGVGDIVPDLFDISQSYEVAFEMLEVKASIGPNRVISPEMIAAKPPVALYDQLDNIRSMIFALKTDRAKWTTQLHALFTEMKISVSSRKSIANLADYLQYHLTLEISEMAEEIQTHWREQLLPELQRAIKHFATIDELEQRVHDVLSDIAQRIGARRELNSQYHHVDKMKTFIQTRFSDPNLSLNQISEHFQLSPSHFSVIFKELLSERFIDYLTRIRIEHAKLLLKTTDAPVQDIALQVGYVYSISFIRVFKKLEGMTPRDFRQRQKGA